MCVIGEVGTKPSSSRARLLTEYAERKRPVAIIPQGVRAEPVVANIGAE